MFLRERLEGICIFLPPQSRISLKHSRNLEEFQCVKDKGASLSWTPVTSDPSAMEGREGQNSPPTEREL